MTRIISRQETRVETGPVQFGEDWPGVFIRGDEAMGLAAQIEALQPCDSPIGAVLNRVTKLLNSCLVETA